MSSSNKPQLSKNLNSANSMIKTAVQGSSVSSKSQKPADMRKAQEEMKREKQMEAIQASTFGSKSKKTPETKKTQEEQENNNEQPFENVLSEKSNPIEEKLPEEEQKQPMIDQQVKKESESMNKQSLKKKVSDLPQKEATDPSKKQSIKKKIADLEQGITSLDKITSSKQEIKPTQTLRKPRLKYINGRLNVLEGHDFQSLMRHAENIRTEIEEDSRFIDSDYQNAEGGVDTKKYMGGFRNELLETAMDQLEWVQFMKIALEGGQAKLFGDIRKKEAFRGKIVMGVMEDASVLNALAMICGNETLIRSLCFWDQDCAEKCSGIQKDGIYGFRFFKNKTEKYSVIVDDRLACLTDSNSAHVPLFARSSEPNEFWVSMIEKAYAKLNFSYNAIAKIGLRQAINEFTGLEPEIFTFTQEMINEEDLWLSFDLLLKNGSLVGVMAREIESSSEKQNLIFDKLYILIEIIHYQSSNKKILKLLDPWANLPNLKEIIPSKTLETAPKQAMQLIEYPQCLTIFNTVIFLKDFPNEWTGVRIECPLAPSLGLPSAANTSWTKSPQYQLEVTSNKEIQVLFRIAETKLVSSDSPNLQLGFLLFRLSPKEDLITTMNNEKLVCNARSQNESFVQKIVKLEKGRYVVIPFSAGKQIDVTLNLEIYYNCPVYQLKFTTKTEKIISRIENEDFDEANPRTLKDLLKDQELIGYKFSNSKLSVKDLMIPGNMCQSFLKDFSSVSKQSLIQNNQKIQKINPKVNAASENQMENTQKSGKFYDPKISTLKENVITETLLGLKDDFDETEFPQEENNNQPLGEQQPEVYDFNYYGMSDVGLDALILVLFQETSIKTLKLAGNSLSDQAIIKLCYELEKTKHLDLEELDLRENLISNKGVDALYELASRNTSLKAIRIEDNEKVTMKQMEKLAALLESRVPKKTVKGKRKAEK